jgi:ribonuclease Z
VGFFIFVALKTFILKLHILGCYAATPRSLTNPTSQVLEINSHMFMIDCGEGTQVQLRKHKIKFTKIKHVFISHLHGDHFFGLIGLISTFALFNRTQDLHVYGPKGIKEIILLQLKISKSYTGYGLYFHEISLPTKTILFEDDKVRVSGFPMKHRIETHGFLFEEKNQVRPLNIQEIEKYGIDISYYNKIKYGGDLTLEDGTVLLNSQLTLPQKPLHSYAFCSDTLYDEALIPYIKNATVLYHESTFLDSEAHLATKTMHATAKQAATIALQANVKQLILGHYSTRYASIAPFKEEASSVFEQVLLADDGAVFDFTTK